MRSHLMVLTLLAVSSSLTARGDVVYGGQLPKQPAEHFSADRRFAVQVRKQDGWTATLREVSGRERWTVPLEEAPDLVLVADSGRSVVMAAGACGAGDSRQTVLTLYGPEGQEVRHFSFEDLLNAEELVWLPEEYRCLGWSGIGKPMQRLDEPQGELVLGPLPRLEGDEPLGTVRIALSDGRVLNRSAETSLALEDLLGRFRSPQSADEQFTVAVLLSRLEAPQLRSLWLELVTAAATEERLYWVAMSGLRRLGPEVPPVALAGRLGRSEAFDERFLQWVADEKPTVPVGVWRAMMLNRKAAAWVRNQALDLALRDEPDNVPLLLEALGDDTLRRDAVMALGWNPLPGALDAVVRLLEHRDPRVRSDADSLLGESYARRAPDAKRLEVEALKPRSPLGRAPRTLKAVVTRAELRGDLERARVLATRLLDCARTEAAPVPREDLRVTSLARLAEIALAQGRRAELDRLLSLLKGSREDAWGCDPFRLKDCSLVRVPQLVEQLLEVANAPVELQVRLRQGAIELRIKNRVATPLRFPTGPHLTVNGWSSGHGCLNFATLSPAPEPSSEPPPPLPASPAEAAEAAMMAFSRSLHSFFEVAPGAEKVFLFPLPPCRVETQDADSAAYSISTSHFKPSRTFHRTIEHALWPRSRQGHE